MAFQTKDLSVLAYANGFSLWHYRTDDRVIAPDYFDAASAMLRVGDMILTNLEVAPTPVAAIFLVTHNKEGFVNVAAMQAAVVTPEPREADHA